ncbi:MAG: hypothetical protein KGJ88_01250 [Verrucomicrobiota bacterium]|nr:hypothetical protein [Verrucomicrobiota bacterium]
MMERPEKNAPGAAFKAVILYNDPHLVARATALVNRAVRCAGGGAWSVASYHLHVLKQPPLAALTVGMAADAHFMLLAIGALPPTAELLDWLEQWSAQRHVVDATVSLLCPEDATEPPQLRSRLQHIARRHGLEFFATVEAWHGEDAPALVPA